MILSLFKRLFILSVLATLVFVGFQPATALSGALQGETTGKILFTSDRGSGYGVYVVNADGTNLQKLVQDSIQNGTTTWSSANKIAYVSIRDGKPQIYTMDPDGKNQTRITDNTSWATGPSWHPDGKQLLYVYENTETVGVIIRDIASGKETKPKRSLWTDSLKFSPDGKQIAYIAQSATNIGGIGLTVANVDGSSPRVVFNIAVSSFTWSPDGKSLAFSYWGQQGGEIDVVSVKGGKPKQLAKYSSQNLAWSPDGKSIVVSRYDQKLAKSGLFLLAPDGSGEKFLVEDPESKGFSWSPDGTKIAFVSGRDHRVSIYTMDLDGSNVNQLTDMPGIYIADTTRSVSPDGSKILLTAQGNIMTLDMNGKNLQTLTKGYNPIWSPEGKQITFSSYDASTKKAGIFVMDADGNNRTLLTNQSSIPVSWSSDGQKIMFQVFQWSDPKAVGIYLIDATGQNLKRLTKDEGNHPALSPDGKQIAYCANKDRKLTVINVDGKKPPIIVPKSNCMRPVWSPEGKQIATIGFGEHQVTIGKRSTMVMGPDIELTDANGKNKHFVTVLHPRTIWNQYLLMWSADSTKLVFTSDMDGNPEIYSINVDGTNLVNLTNNVANDELADVWMPK